VLVRIPGCSSFCVFARCFSRSPLVFRSDSLVMMVRTALTVCSRTKGAESEKPVSISGKILSFTTREDRCSIIRPRLSSRNTRVALSGKENNLTTAGVILPSHSSSDSFSPILSTASKTLGPPPPNSTDFRSSGRIFILK
jgi:hypothetical protein